MDIYACTELLRPGASFNPAYATDRSNTSLWRDERDAPTDEELQRANVKAKEWTAQQIVNGESLLYLENTDWMVTRQSENSEAMSEAEYAELLVKRQAARDAIKRQTLSEAGEELIAEMVAEDLAAVEEASKEEVVETPEETAT